MKRGESHNASRVHRDRLRHTVRSTLSSTAGTNPFPGPPEAPAGGGDPRYRDSAGRRRRSASALVPGHGRRSAGYHARRHAVGQPGVADDAVAATVRPSAQPAPAAAEPAPALRRGSDAAALSAFVGLAFLLPLPTYFLTPIPYSHAETGLRTLAELTAMVAMTMGIMVVEGAGGMAAMGTWSALAAQWAALGALLVVACILLARTIRFFGARNATDGDRQRDGAVYGDVAGGRARVVS